MSDVQMSLAEELGKALDEAETAGVDHGAPVSEGAAQGDDSVAGAGGEDSAPGAASADTAAGASGGDRVRDESGRFVKKPDAAADPAKAQETQQQAAAPGEQKPVADIPPSTWTPAAKAAYMALPADSPLRNEIKKREADFQKGINDYKQRADFGERVLREFQPYEAIMRAQGGTPEAVLRNLLNTAYLLNTGTPQQRGELLMQAAKQYGADLSKYMQPAQAGEQPQQPDIRAMVDQLVQPYVRQFSQFTNQFQSAQQQAEQARHQEAQGQIEAFRTATDEKGQPKHAYFDNVRGIMASLIEAGNASSIDQAYEMACRAHPEVSAALTAAQRQDAERKQLEDAKRKAEDARRAGAVNVSGQGGVGIADTSKLGLREEISARMDGRL